MNKQQLANKIWESANKMRSKIEANEYKDYILGFIFYKYLSDQEVQFLKKQDWEDGDIKSDLKEENKTDLEFIRNNLGYFISYNDLFSTWLGMGNDFDVSNVRDGLSAFSRLISPSHKKVFEGVFDTLQTGLSKLGDSASSQTKSISDLLQLIKDIPMDGKQDYDVLGFIYEYLISNFAANAGKKAGEFYTPHEVSLLMSEIIAWHLKDRKEIEIYDPTSGSGSLLINIGKTASKYIGNSDNIKYYAQELKQNTYNLTRMNLVMRGIKPANLNTRNGDTLEKDWPWFDESDPEKTYNPLYVDAVVSNPPYSQAWDPTGKENDPRYSRFGLAPKSKADYAFLLHDLFHLKPDGIMTIVLPHGVLFRGGEEGEIRKNLVEGNHIDAIIGLPANIFFGTGIPTIIMVLRQKREHTDTLIIDASKDFEKVGKNNRLRACDIKKIADTYIARQAIDGYSKKVSREEIRSNDYNLNIPRYVDSSEKTENYDIYASMFGGIPKVEIEELSEYWKAFPKLKEKLFKQQNNNYFEIATPEGTGNIQKEVLDCSSVKKFNSDFTKAFESFNDFLKSELLENTDKLNISQEEETIAQDIFERLKNIPLVDRYNAFQILDDAWQETAADLEMIQTEGFEAVKKVDPLMVVKKVKGIDQEVQDGWCGHIIPFGLVEDTILKTDKDRLVAKQNELEKIAGEYEELLESFSEEDKEHETVNEDGTDFVKSAIAKEAKQFRKEKSNDSYALKVIAIDNLIEKEMKIKRQISDLKDELLKKTITTIENLSDEQAKMLLEKKWIAPLEEKLKILPETLVSTLCSKIKAIAEKYAETLVELEAGIENTSKELCDLIDDLTGDEFDMKGLQELKKLLLG